MDQLDSLTVMDQFIGEETLHSMDSIALSAGAKELLLSDFNALKEAQTLNGDPKYAERPTLETLAKIICAQSGGPHKDIALFELAHFCKGLAELKGEDQVLDILLTPQKPSASRFKSLLTPLGPCETIFTDEIGLHLSLENRDFTIRYGRMAVLCGLFDFLCAMDQFGSFSDIQDCFQTLYKSPLSPQAIQNCANRLGAILRKYRIKTLTYQEADGKFLQVLKFLQSRNTVSQLNIQDEDIFEFWCLHNTGKDFKGYRTVFDLFCDFTHALEQTSALKEALSAAPLGLAREQGEIDVSDQDVADMQTQWTNPFEVFDDPQLSEIRFFKKASERIPLENLMSYGPDALAFPVAFLRYDVFGHVQSGITNDLQVGRGKASVEARISGKTTPAYEAHLETFRKIEDHLKILQGACLYLIRPKDPQSEGGIYAQSAFQKINRKGFEAGGDPVPFERAAPALIRLSEMLARYLNTLSPHDMILLFEQDQDRFKTQFQRLYADVLS